MVFVVLLAFLVAVSGSSLVATTFLVQTVFIPSRSMEPTLTVGDRVVVSKLTPEPFDLRRGDIVVFIDPGGWTAPRADTHSNTESPLDTTDSAHATRTSSSPPLQASNDRLIKRVIGLPGDRVACCGSDGRLLVNGTVIDERVYLPRGMEPSRAHFDITVPADELWVMGDNRAISADSREHPTANHSGFVPINLVVGRAGAVVWPASRVAWLGTPRAFGYVDEAAEIP